jgi:hypothetical protein
MDTPSQPDHELEQRVASSLLDALIRAGLIVVMAICATVSSPHS